MYICLAQCLVRIKHTVNGDNDDDGGGHAAAPAKSCQSCPTLCNPMDGSPPGSSVPGILQARILEWVAIAFSKTLPIPI